MRALNRMSVYHLTAGDFPLVWGELTEKGLASTQSRGNFGDDM